MRYLSLICTLLTLTTPVFAQVDPPITPENASQLVELGRGEFYLEPALAPDALALSPDGDTLAVGTLQGLFLIDIGEFLRRGSATVPVGGDATVLEWEIQFQKPVFSPDGQFTVALAGVQWQPDSIYVWQVETDEVQTIQSIPPGFLQSLAFRPDSNELYYTYFVDPIRFTDPESIIPTGVLDYLFLDVSAVPFNSFEQANQQFEIRGFDSTGTHMHYVAHDLNTDTITHHFWSFEERAEITPIFTGYLDAVLSPDWSRAAWFDGPALLLRDVSARMTTTISLDADHVTRLWFSPDSRLLVGATTTGNHHDLRLWDSITGEELAVFDLDNYAATEALFSPDQTRLIARLTPTNSSESRPDQLVVWAVS